MQLCVEFSKPRAILTECNKHVSPRTPMLANCYNSICLPVFPQIRGRGAPADQQDMVPDGDHAVRDRPGLCAVPDHLHTQLLVV